MTEYEVKNIDQFKTLVGRYPDTTIKAVDNETDMIYGIEGQEFITDAEGLGIIEEWGGHGGVWSIDSPKQLRNIITSVERADFGEETVFSIKTKRGTIKIRGEDMFKLISYKQQLLLKCKIALSFSLRGKGKSEEFDEFLSWMVDTAVETWKSTETEDEILCQMIMGELRALPVVTRREDMVSEYTVIDDDDNVYKIQGSCVMGVARGVVGNISFVRLQSVLQDELAAVSSQIRIRGARVSMWNFKTDGWE